MWPVKAQISIAHVFEIWSDSSCTRLLQSKKCKTKTLLVELMCRLILVLMVHKWHNFPCHTKQTVCINSRQNSHYRKSWGCTDVLHILLFLQTRQGCLRVIVHVPTILFSPMLSHPGPAKNYLLSIFGYMYITGHASMLSSCVAFSDGDTFM